MEKQKPYRIKSLTPVETGWRFVTAYDDGGETRFVERPVTHLAIIDGGDGDDTVEVVAIELGWVVTQREATMDSDHPHALTVGVRLPGEEITEAEEIYYTNRLREKTAKQSA